MYRLSALHKSPANETNKEQKAKQWNSIQYRHRAPTKLHQRHFIEIISTVSPRIGNNREMAVHVFLLLSCSQRIDQVKLANKRYGLGWVWSPPRPETLTMERAALDLARAFCLLGLFFTKDIRRIPHVPYNNLFMAVSSNFGVPSEALQGPYGSVIFGLGCRFNNGICRASMNLRWVMGEGHVSCA